MFHVRYGSTYLCHVLRSTSTQLSHIFPSFSCALTSSSAVRCAQGMYATGCCCSRVLMSRVLYAHVFTHLHVSAMYMLASACMFVCASVLRRGVSAACAHATRHGPRAASASEVLLRSPSTLILATSPSMGLPMSPLSFPGPTWTRSSSQQPLMRSED